MSDQRKIAAVYKANAAILLVYLVSCEAWFYF